HGEDPLGAPWGAREGSATQGRRTGGMRVASGDGRSSRWHGYPTGIAAFRSSRRRGGGGFADGTGRWRGGGGQRAGTGQSATAAAAAAAAAAVLAAVAGGRDRKSTRLNSSHVKNS